MVVKISSQDYIKPFFFIKGLFGTYQDNIPEVPIMLIWHQAPLEQYFTVPVQGTLVNLIATYFISAEAACMLVPHSAKTEIDEV